MAVSESLNRNGDTDGKNDLTVVLDRMCEGDRITVVREIDGETVGADDTTTIKSKRVTILWKVSCLDDTLSLDLVSVTSVIKPEYSSWHDAQVVMDDEGVYLHSADDWYMTGREIPFDSGLMSNPVRILVGADGQTCLTDEEADELAYAIVRKILGVPDSVPPEALTGVTLDRVRDALVKHRQPGDEK